MGMSMGEARVTRGRFMQRLGSMAGAAIGLSIALSPGRAFALVSGTGTLSKITSLQKLRVGVNGSFKLSISAPPPTTNAIFLVRSATGTVTALESTCRHRGCPVAWVAADNRFECPCHGSQYASTGKVVLGPAMRNLYSHQVVVRAGLVWVFSTRSTQ